MDRILVVGGAGYIGGAVTDLLLANHLEFRVLDTLLYEEVYRKPVAFYNVDVRDHAALLQHLPWADIVIWLAALVGDGACAIHPGITKAINQDSVQFLADNFDGRIVFPSTASVYGVQDDFVDESSPTNPLSVYAETKLECERILARKDALILRLGTLFGLGDLFSRIRLDLVVNTMSVKAQLHGALQVFGGRQYRPVLHVRDAALAMFACMNTGYSGVFDLVHENVRIGELGRRIAKAIPGTRVEVIPWDKADTRSYRVRGEKAKALPFNSSLGIEVGIQELSGLVSYGRLPDPDNPRFTNQRYLSAFNDRLQR